MSARAEAIEAAAQLLALSIAVSEHAYEQCKTGLRTVARRALSAEGLAGPMLDAAVLEYLADAMTAAERIISAASLASAPAAGTA